MGTSSDVRAILDLPQQAIASSSSSQLPQQRKATSTSRKPDGITRELYALIGDNAPFLAEAQATINTTKYRERPKTKPRHAKWELTPFTPLAKDQRSTHVLRHWERVSDGQPGKIAEYFASFNQHGPSVMEYSQYEYDLHLADPNWTAHETAYLFDMLRVYDLRFIVVADRYEYSGSQPLGPARTRSVEDIKDRYYTVCRRLIRTRAAGDPAAQQQQVQLHAFDKAREIKRKQYASELYHLTAAEIAEEEALFVEIKRLEQVERRYGADRDHLMRTIMGLDSGLVDLDQENTEVILGVDKSKKRKRADEEAPASPVAPVTKKQKEDAASDAAHCIFRVPPLVINANTSHLAAKHPPHVPAFARSIKMPVPPQTAAIRISSLMTELGVATQRLVMPTRLNLDAYDSLLVAVGALVDIKRQVDRVEQECRTLQAQREAFVAPLQSSGRSSSVASVATESERRATANE